MQIDQADFINFITIKEGLDSSSVRHCASRIKVFRRWLSDSGFQLDKQSVENFFLYLKQKPLKNNSLNTYLFMFRHLVSYCRDRGLPHNFFDGFKSFKKGKSDIVIFTHEEIEKIIDTRLVYGKFRGKDCDYLNFRYQTMTMFLAYTGCRYSEASELTVEHVDISAGKATLVNTKNNENRTVYFAEPLKSRIRQLIGGRGLNDRVFRNTTEKKIQVTDYSQDLKRRAREAGLTKRVFPHNFRHSYATHMLEAGVPIAEVATLVGHKDIRMTYSTYMHLADKTLERAAMRHPMVRKNIAPEEIMKSVKETIDNLHLESDSRFKYFISEETGKLNFSLSVK